MSHAAWPEKTREFHNHHFDSTIWNDLQFRADDIVISTYAKSGTTWVQQIVSQLLFGGRTDLPVAEMSPWLDLECTGESAISQAKADPMVVPGALREFGLMYAPKDQLRHGLVSPLYANLKGLPPMFIQASSSEVLYDDTTRFEKKLKEAGVDVEVEIWEKMVHVWQAYAPILPEAMKAIKIMGSYIEKKTK